MNEIPKLGCKTDWSKDVKVLTSEISKCYEAINHIVQDILVL